MVDFLDLHLQGGNTHIMRPFVEEGVVGLAACAPLPVISRNLASDSTLHSGRFSIVEGFARRLLEGTVLIG